MIAGPVPFSDVMIVEVGLLKAAAGAPGFTPFAFRGEQAFRCLRDVTAPSIRVLTA
jgi:hypothetical protein